MENGGNVYNKKKILRGDNVSAGSAGTSLHPTVKELLQWSSDRNT